jgi:transposase
MDAEFLARQGRADPGLLHPIQHRGVEAQADLALLSARDALVRSRTLQINHVRGLVKSFGGRIPSCSAESFHKSAPPHLPQALGPALEPLLESIAALTQKIRRFDAQIERACEEHHPETARLRQIAGVGALTSLCYVLVLEEPDRFQDRRAVGSYLGLVPKLCESGGKGRGPELSISKAGHMLLRRLLVGSAHYILGPHGPDTDLRRWGLQIAERGGKKAKRRAVVAVARKLSVLLHSLWTSGQTYVPLRMNSCEESA